MKNRNKISYFSHALMTLVFMGAVSACVNDDFVDKVVNKTSVDGLALSPTIADAKVVTRSTPSNSDLKEDELVTLDVFVEDVSSTDAFFKKYHLTIASATKETINNEVAYLLENKWFDQGYRADKNYNVYVAVNNPKTTKAADDAKPITNSAALKALTYDEVEEGVAEVNADGKIIRVQIDEDDDGKPIYKYTGNIYKLYNSSAPANETSRDQTPNKQFMMDGFVPNWSPTEGKPIQTIPVNLSRAAAKIVLNVEFDSNFLTKLQSEEVSITGTPAWQFQNFAFSAPVFDPKIFGTTGEGETEEETQIIPRSADNMIYGGTQFGEDKSFSIVTYSYPISWTDYAGAPSLIVSIPYTSSDGTSYNYYRVPIVKNDEDITPIDRNTIYVINATIATRGSDTHEDITEIGDLKYEVLPWNDKNNSDAIHNEVESVQHEYLKVNPKVYTLHGDDNQTLIINYQKASGTEVGWQLYSFNTTTEAKGNPVDDPESGVWGWYYDKNGKMKTTYTGLTHMGVTIEQSQEGNSDSKGTVTVTSKALDNRAIKYMLLRVYLKDNPDLFEDVIIRHFPTDNIQSITGKWSSYHTGASTSEETWDPVASGWAEGTYDSKEVEVNSTDPYDHSVVKHDGTPSNHDSGDYHYEYSSGQNGTTVQTQYRDNISQGVNRYRTNGETNAALGADGYWYWGDTRIQATTYDNYDWLGNNGNGGIFSRAYRWTNYHRSKYKKTHYYRTLYYRTTSVTPETGDWVDWDRDAGKEGRKKTTSTTNGQFEAHIFGNDGQVHYIDSSNDNMASQGSRVGAVGRYNNNHMYVVQISSTSNKYVLGKPLVGTNNQSQDQLVAPAFMIASQLGIVGSDWSSTSAAEHCARYLEVGTDGTRYAGWRLPTNDEITVISDYQQGMFGTINVPEADRVMDYVLKGSHYYNLSGETSAIPNYTGQDGNFLRCIRELSAEEIEKLNGFDAIVQKYRSSGI